jgi:hypothetical protein
MKRTLVAVTLALTPITGCSGDGSTGPALDNAVAVVSIDVMGEQCPVQTSCVVQFVATAMRNGRRAEGVRVYVNDNGASLADGVTTAGGLFWFEDNISRLYYYDHRPVVLHACPETDNPANCSTLDVGQDSRVSYWRW